MTRWNKSSKRGVATTARARNLITFHTGGSILRMNSAPVMAKEGRLDAECPAGQTQKERLYVVEGTGRERAIPA